MSRHATTLPRSTWTLLLILTFGWGMNWPMIKLAVAEIPVWTFRALCVGAGSVGMFAIAHFSGVPLRVPRRDWGALAAMAACNVTLWNVLSTYAVSLLPAGRSAILAYTMPLWTVLLSAVFLGERLTLRRTAGLALGMGGLVLLLIDSLASIGGRPEGALLMLAAAIAWSAGTVLMKRRPLGVAVTTFTGWNFLLGGIPIVIGALLFDPPHWRAVGPAALAGLAYNMSIAFVLCFWAWFKIVTLAPAGVSALGTLFIPVVAVFSGMLVLGERPAATDLAALALILGALATVVVPGRRPEAGSAQAHADRSVN
jgi:drug/metabolite transporter (DMT)-like permease